LVNRDKYAVTTTMATTIAAVSHPAINGDDPIHTSCYSNTGGMFAPRPLGVHFVGLVPGIATQYVTGATTVATFQNERVSGCGPWA
jgi:hypothetical protein